MNFELTKPYEYEDLKTWFRENWHELPKTLDTETMRIGTVQYSVKLHVGEYDNQIKKHGDRAKRMNVCRAAKARLIAIYEGLQDESQWNLPLEKVEKKFRL